MASTQREIILSGIRPTGRLHYGNYFGAIRHFLRLQEQDTATCYYFVADYHALTTITEPTDIYANTIAMLRTYAACGLDPEKSVIYRQSDLPCTAELALLLGMMSDYLFGRRAAESSWAAALHAIVPNWQHFWMADALHLGETIPFRYVLGAAAYGGFYLLGLLGLGIVLFRHTEVKS